MLNFTKQYTEDAISPTAWSQMKQERQRERWTEQRIPNTGKALGK